LHTVVGSKKRYIERSTDSRVSQEDRAAHACFQSSFSTADRSEMLGLLGPGEVEQSIVPQGLLFVGDKGAQMLKMED